MMRLALPLLLTLMAGSARAETPTAVPKSQAAPTPWAETLSQEALASGFLSKLPPNLSVVFGLAKPQEGTDVRQLIAKEGPQVRTFNVGVANHNDIVIFNVNAHSGATVAYLITPSGQLRKAVTYQTGAQATDLAPGDAKAGLAREKKYWSARAKASAAATAAAPPAAQSASGH